MAAVMSSFAQFERDLIGQRTRAALAVKKAQGIKLGRERSIPDSSIEAMRALRTGGLTYRQVAERLNAEGVQTGRGGTWWPATVQQALKARETPDTGVMTA
jgi:DNA invertase Pin-like site-specific DNA recombinase